MFSPQQTFSITFPRPDGDVEITLSWPSDAQLTAFHRTRRIAMGNAPEAVVEQLEAKARGASLALIREIAAPGSPDLDEYEAEAALDQLLRVQTQNVERVAGRLEMQLETIFGELPVAVTVPSQAQLAAYRKAAVDKREIGGHRTMAINMGAAATLFRSINVDAIELPITYQAAVCGAVGNYVDGLLKTTAVPQ